MFHAGQGAQLMGGKYRENASVEVGVQRAGIRYCPDGARPCAGAQEGGECGRRFRTGNRSGKQRNRSVGHCVTLKLKDGKVVSKQIDGVLTDTKEYGVSESFMRHFALQYGGG